MADSSKLLLFGGLAAAAYYYFYVYSPSTTTAAAATPAAAPPPNPNAIVGVNTLDGIYGKLGTAAGANASMGVDAWGTYLAPLLPAGDTPPDPLPIFTAAVPGFDRSQPLTIGQYWAVMAPALKTQFGLSGLGVMGMLHRWRGW